MKPEIYDFLDYQEYLRAYYSAEKARDSLFSFRVLAAAVGIDASLLVKIMQGKRHLSRAGCDLMVDFLRLGDGEKEYFRELVAYGKADDDNSLRMHFERLLSLRPAASARIDSDRYRYFQFWYYPAIRSALDVFIYNGPADAVALGALFNPPLSDEQVCEAMEVLERLGLVTREESGRMRPATAHLSTGERWQSAAVREYQKQLTQLAGESITRFNRTERDISTLTMALNSRQIARIQAVLSEARQSIVRHADAMQAPECDAVYQLNIQFFPLMRLAGSEATP